MYLKQFYKSNTGQLELFCHVFHFLANQTLVCEFGGKDHLIHISVLCLRVWRGREGRVYKKGEQSRKSRGNWEIRVLEGLFFFIMQNPPYFRNSKIIMQNPPHFRNSKIILDEGFNGVLEGLYELFKFNLYY